MLNLNKPKRQIPLQAVSIPCFSPSNLHLSSDSSSRYAVKYFCAFSKSNSEQSILGSNWRALLAEYYLHNTDIFNLLGFESSGDCLQFSMELIQAQWFWKNVVGSNGCQKYKPHPAILLAPQYSEVQTCYVLCDRKGMGKLWILVPLSAPGKVKIKK